MKFLFVHNYYKQKGGEDLVVKMEMDLLRKNGHDVDLYSISNDLIKTKRQKFYASLAFFFSFRQFFRFYKKLMLEKPDFVHCHNIFPLLGPAIIYACWFARVKCVMTLHNYRLVCPTATLFFDGDVYLDSLDKGYWVGIKKRLYRDSMIGSAIIAFSNVFHKRLDTWGKVYKLVALSNFQCRLLGSKVAGVFVIKPNFLFSEELPVERNSGQDELEQMNFLFVGRLAVEKGVLQLIADWPEDQYFHLKIVGLGDQYQNALIQATGRGNICVVGEKCSDEVAFLMASSAALIVPSLWYEGCPMVVLEALRLGLPVLANDIGSLSEMVVDEWNGLKYNALDPASLAASLDKFRFMDHALIRRNCLIEFEEKYSEYVGYKNLMKLYS